MRKHPFREEGPEMLLWAATMMVVMMIAFDPYRPTWERWFVPLIPIVAMRWWIVKARKIRREDWRRRNGR